MKIIFETLFSPAFDVLHSPPIVYMDHTELIFQDLLLYCTKKVPENHNLFFHFRHGGETHFLVLAQTLIYIILFSDTSPSSVPEMEGSCHRSGKEVLGKVYCLQLLNANHLVHTPTVSSYKKSHFWNVKNKCIWTYQLGQYWKTV